MNELEVLYNSYVDNGLLSKNTSFDVFKKADSNIKESLYQQGLDNGVLSKKTNFEQFNSAWDKKQTIKKKETSAENSENIPLAYTETETVGSLESNAPKSKFKREFLETPRDNTNIKSKTLKLSKPFFKENKTPENTFSNEEFDTLLEDVTKEAEQRIIDREERIKGNIDSFREKTSFTEDDEKEIKERFDSEKEVSTFENIIDGSLTFFKRAIGLPSSIAETKTTPFETEIKQVKANSKKNDEKLADEEVLKRAEELFLEKEKDNIFNDKANTFLSELDPVSKGEVQNLLNTSIKGFSEENKKLSVSNLALKPILMSGQEELEKRQLFFRENPDSITEKDVSEFNDLRNDLIEKSEIYNRNQDKLISNTKDLQSLEKEYDFFKRSYDGVFIENFAISTTELIVGGIDFINFLGQYSNPAIPIRNPAPLFDTSKIREEIKADRENIRKPIQSVESVDGFLNYTSDLVANQLPTLIATSTGYGGLAVIGASSTGQKHAEMTDEIKSGNANYEAWQMMLVPIGHGSAEAIFEIPTLSILKKGKRVLGSALKQSPSLFKQPAKETFKSFGTDFLKENFAEQGTNLLQNGLNIYALGKEGNITDNALDVFKDTSVMTLMLQGAPHIMSKALKPFQSKDNIKILEENAFKMQNLYADLKNSNITETEKKLIETEIEKINTNSSNIMRTVINDVSEMDDSTRNQILEINKKAGKLRFQANEILENGKSKNKENLLDIISNEHALLQEKREKILLEYVSKPKKQISVTVDGKKQSFNTETFKDFAKDDANIQGIIDGDIDISINNDNESIDLLNKKINELSKPVSENTQDFVSDVAENLSDIEDISEFVGGASKVSVGNTDIVLKESGKNIKIESIQTPENQRGEGNDRKALEKVIEVADSKNKPLELNIVPLDDKTEANKLIEFYESEGFVKEKDFSNDGGKMIRLPQSTKVEDLTESTETFFDPAESEGESIGRLSQNIIAENKEDKQNQINDIAKKHTESYKQYLKEQNAPKEVLESEFVKTFEKRLVGALKNLDKFDFEQSRGRENGSRIDENNNEISELDYLIKQGDIDSKTNEKTTQSENDTVANADIRPTTETSEQATIQPTVDNSASQTKTKANKKKFHKINSKEYSIEFSDGRINVEPRFGKGKIKPSTSVIKQATDIYISETDFSKGDLADINFRGTQEQYNEVIAEKSNNPQEIASAILRVNESNKETFESLELTKESAIAQAFGNDGISNIDLNQFTDLSAYYKIKKNKKPIDKIRESAEEIYGQEVEFDDIVQFAQQYSSPSKYFELKKDSVIEDVSGLEVRFKKVTGLKATKENIEKVHNKQPKKESQEQTEEDTESDVPFQAESTQERLKGQSLNNLIRRLSASGLSSDVIRLNDNQIKNKLNSLKRPFSETPNSFVANNVVYINTDKVKRDSPIHEFGHLWNQYTKENFEDVYNRGIELIDDSEYHKAILNNDAYKNLSDEAKLEEALAQAIGEKGVKIVNETLKDKFSLWFNRLFSRIARGLGLTNLNEKQLTELTLDQFTDLASAEILRGRNVKNGELLKDLDKTSIDYVLDVQDGIINARKKVLDRIGDKNLIEKDVKKALFDYINQNIKRESIKEASKNELERLIKIVSKSKTESNYNSALSKIDKIVEKLNKKEFSKHYETLKSRALAKENLRNDKIEKSKKIKSVKEYRKKAINKKWLSNITFTDIDAIQKAIDLGSKKSLSQAIDKIDLVAKRLEDKYNEQQARLEHRSRLAKNKATDKKLNIKARKKALLDFININLDNKNLNKISKSKISKLLKSVSNTDNINDKQLSKKLKEAEQIIVTATNKVLLSKIDSLLDEKIVKKVSGRDSAVNNTDLVKKVFDQVKEDTRVSKGSVNEKKQILIDKGLELEQKRELIYNKIRNNESLSEQEINDLFTLGISISTIDAKTTDDYNKAQRLLLGVENAVSNFYNSQKIQFKQQINEAKQEKENIVNNLIDSIKSEKNSEEISDRKLRALESKQVFWLNKILTSINPYSALSYFSDSLDSISGFLDKDKGTTRSEGRLISFVDKIKRDIRKSQIRTKQYNDKNYNILKRLYGKPLEQDLILNKEFVIELDTNEESDIPDAFTKSNLINVYQMYQDVDLRSGLAKTGFTEKVVAEIESKILTDKDIEYANELFNMYEQSYLEENETYKRKYFTDMPKADFYAGKVFRDIDGEPAKLEDVKGNNNRLTTTHGSQKGRVINNNAIIPQDVRYLFKRHLIESSDFIHLTESFDIYSKFISDKRLKKNLYNEHGKTKAKIILKILEHHQKIIVNGVPKGEYDVAVLRWLDITARKLSKSVLALKPILLVKQTTSMINASAEMPSGKSVIKNLSYYTDVKGMIDALNFIKNNSDFYKLRYTKDIDLIISGLSQVYDNDVKLTTSNNVNTYLKEINRIYNFALDKGMVTIKTGDKIGVMGALPVYLSWLDTYKSQDFSDDVAKKKAMEKFESTADRTQQTGSDVGKSRFQTNPYLRYFAIFKSTPLQNIGNVAFHWKQLFRKKKNRKGSIPRHVFAIANYQFAQPLLYYYISNMIVGAIRQLLGFDDEDDKKIKEQTNELYKGLKTTGIISNQSSIPIIGDMSVFVLDKLVFDKKQTFGNNPSAPNITAMTKNVTILVSYILADNEAKKQKLEDKLIKSSLTLSIGFPEYLTQFLTDYDLYTDEKTDDFTKINKILGYSNWILDNNSNLNLEERNILLKLNRKYENNKSYKAWKKTKLK